MIRYTLSVAVLLASVLAGCDGGSSASTTADVPSAPAMPVSEPVPFPAVRAGSLEISPGGMDFGLIGARSKHDVSVMLKNLGQQPITLTKVQSTCQCTKPEDLTGTVIPAGGSVPLATVFSARPVPGDQDAKVVVQFQTPGEPRHRSATLRMEGEVTMAVRAEPAYVDALKGKRSGEIKLDSIDGRPFEIISAFGVSPQFVDGGGRKSEHTLRWALDYPAAERDCGGQKLWWVIETDHPDCPILPLRIRHECTGMRTDANYKQRGWIFRDYIVNVGEIRAGEPVEADATLWRINKQATLDVQTVESLSPDATAELVKVVEPADDDTFVTVRLTPRFGYSGMLYAMVNIKTRTGAKDVAFVARVVD